MTTQQEDRAAIGLTIWSGSQPNARALTLDLPGDRVHFGDIEIRPKALVALGEGLDIAAPTARVVAPRMREEGWLAAREEGCEAISRPRSSRVDVQ